MMTVDTAILIVQTASVLFLALWLTTGVWENLFYPTINRTFTTEVLEMKRLREDYPEAYAMVSKRRITDSAIQNFLFRVVVVWQLLTSLLLWGAAVWLVLAIFGASGASTARVLGLLAAGAFTAIWAGFLVLCNWFCYWFCHGEAQNTHFQLALWGLATLVLLAIG